MTSTSLGEMELLLGISSMFGPAGEKGGRYIFLSALFLPH